ncbi:MAG: 16S rRNA (cytosine(1402)-N(4))-methyltransferase RsmH [Deltaproteobacteria bacterium]|nr:16S rRNA (cytosine(1402)-N(4))-methyltransferase RsmH [Deltaproteobacteria bacterium]
MIEMEYPHKPVMVNEVVKLLVKRPDGTYVDGTTGSGGHSEAILRKLGENGRLICLDRDPDAIEITRRRLGAVMGKGNFSIIKANFADMDSALGKAGVQKVDGILLDLGMSSYQLDHSGRGFSFNRDEPLDMRMDNESGKKAMELINELSSQEIESVLKKYGEEKLAKPIARTIVRERNRSPISSSGRFADIVRSHYPVSQRNRKKDPATRAFQALRILTNSEMENLEAILEKAPDLLNKGGRIIFLTYHSLEDRLVKRAMADWENSCICPPDLPVCVCGKKQIFKRLNKRGFLPQPEEIAENPRARSARLRGAERI